MANIKTELERNLARVEGTRDLNEKVRILTDCLSELTEELRFVLSALGPENFSEAGLRRLIERVKEG